MRSMKAFTTADLVGSWKLESFQIEELSGTIRPWGSNLHGLLIYAPTGHMSVSINRDVIATSDNESKNLFDSILFYAGTYSIEGDIIRHQVTEASNPSRIGKELIRYTQLEGDTVRLTTPKESFGTAILTWKRI
jgi:hypothetical protein